MFERSTSDARPHNQHHRCGFGRTCVNAELTGHDEESGRPIRVGAAVADQPLCGGCMARLTNAVSSMPADYRRLQDHLGDSGSGAGDRVHLTRSAPIPINTATEALMTRIVDTTTRGAEMVADAMNMEPRGWPTDPHATVVRATRMLAQTLRVLLSLEPQAQLVWGRIPTGDEGWGELGELAQPRELVELSGIDVARDLVEINRVIGVQLGKARLRHLYAMPCPAWDQKTKRYCGARTIGRDDGADYFDCSTCGTRWTEEQYGWLRQLVLDEIQVQKESDMLRFLLAEAYWRLDTLRRLAEALNELDIAAVVNDGPEKSAELISLISQQVSAVLTMGAPYTPPEERNPADQKRRRQTAIETPRKAIEA